MEGLLMGFDHYCPFLYNSIGRNNFPYFWCYLVFHCLSEVGFLLLCYQERYHQSRPSLGLMLYVGVFLLPGLYMLGMHSWQTTRNLTTNERYNYRRYTYLHDNEGNFFNPFDRSCLLNWHTRMFRVPHSGRSTDSGT